MRETNILSMEKRINSLEKSGGGIGTDYEKLNNLPKIEGVELIGNKTFENLNIASATDLAQTNDDLLDVKDELINKVSAFVNDIEHMPTIGRFYSNTETTLEKLYNFVNNNGGITYLDRTNATFRNSLVSLGVIDYNYTGVGLMFSPSSSHVMLLWFTHTGATPIIQYTLFDNTRVILKSSLKFE